MKLSTGIEFASTGMKEINVEVNWNKLKRSDKSSSESIVSLPAGEFTFRKLSLPFGDKRKVFSLVEEELSYSLAFGIENASWDFIISPSGEAYAFIAIKDIVKKYREHIKDCEITALARSAIFSGYNNCIVLDFGASKITAVGIHEGFIDLAFVISSGGNDIDKSIASVNNISIVEAKDIKEREGLQNQEFSKIITDSLKIIKQKKYDTEKIVITGGCALAEGFKELVENTLKKEVVFMQFPSGISPYLDAVAFGTAIRFKYPNLSLNFAEEKEKKGGFPYFYFACFLIPMILWVISVGLEANYYKEQVSIYTNAISEKIKKEIPNKKIQNPVRDLTQLIKSKNKNSTLANTKILDVLSLIGEASKGLDNSNSVSIYDVSYDGSNIVIFGEADSIPDVDKIREYVQKSFPSAKMTEGNTLKTKRINFTLKISSKKNKEK